MPRIRRIAAVISVLIASTLIALCAADRMVTAYDIGGVNYPAETLRYRNELLDLRFGPEHGPDQGLDGVLFVHRPGRSADMGSFRISINSLGSRGPEIERKKPDGTRRVLVLGDSVAFGWGVEEADTFVRRFEDVLQQRTKDERQSWEVVNTGIPMYDTVQEAAMLRTVGPIVEPDAVFLVYVVNDVEPTRNVVEEYLRLASGESQVPVPTISQRLGSWFPGLGGLSAPWFRPQFSDEQIAQYRPEEEHAEGWKRSQKALLEIRDWCTARNIPLLVLDHTVPRVHALEPFCAANDIALEPLWFTPEELEMPIYNSMTDTHANRRGQDLLLDKLVAAAERRGLLPPR